MWRRPGSAIIIGGGVAGTSIAKALAERGVKQVTVLEKAGQLCAGATWHAAGLVTRFGGSPKIKKVHVHALDMMTRLHEEESGVGLHLTGSIRLIEKGDKDRLLEAKQHVAMAKLYDDPALPTEMLTASEVASLHPLVDTANIECGVWTPKDGDVDPTMLTTAISRRAKAAGAEFHFNVEVQSVARRSDGSGFDVAVKRQRSAKAAGDANTDAVAARGIEEEDEQVLSADIVVNCAGLWSRKFSNQLGMTHPAFVIEHQYAITEAIPALEGRLGDGQRVPVLRDLAGSSYVRQERDGLLVGPYEEDVVVRSEWSEGPPANFAFDLFPPALDRIEDCLMHAMGVIPVLGEVGIKSVVNGPTIWTGDSLARCGRTRLPGYYDFNSLTYGVAQSLALSEYLGHIIVEGEQPYDMATEFDPLRYGAWANDEYTASKIVETYSHNNSVTYPHENRQGGRSAVAHPPGRLALVEALREHGALFGFSNSGVEVPIAFVPPEDVEVSSEQRVAPQRTFFDHVWAPYADAEAQNLLSGVGIGYSSFSKLRVRSATRGCDAASRLLEFATTNTLPKRAGRCRLTYAPTAAGKLLGEFTVTRRGLAEAHDFYLVGSRDYAQHDLAWLEQQARSLAAASEIESEASVVLEDVTDSIEILHVAGVRSAELMGEICPEADDVPFLQMRELSVLGIDALVFRISFTGEAGFELHVSADDAAKLWRRIWAHPAASELGLAPFGGQAVNALRIEKAFRVKSDLDFAHWTEAGIEPFVALNRKNELMRFLGRDTTPQGSGTAADATLADDDASAAMPIPTRKHAVFTVKTNPAHAWSVPGDAPVLDSNGSVVGFTTTSAKGAVSGLTVALGYVKCGAGGVPLASPGDVGLVVECYGHHWPVALLERPPVAVGGKPEPKLEAAAASA